MRVVLLRSIRGIGQAGDIKDVSDGYARNFLFPQRAARSASEGVVKEVASMRIKKLQSLAFHHQEAQELAARLTGVKILLSGKANKQGTLFAGFEAKHLAGPVSTIAGVQIPADAIKLPGHIKNVGEYTVQIELADQVAATITVVVTAI